MKYYLLFIAFCITFSATAQNELVFINADSSETITVSQKDLVRLSYAGYMGQPQEMEGTVSVINDSSIHISPPRKFLKKKADRANHTYSGYHRFQAFL